MNHVPQYETFIRKAISRRVEIASHDEIVDLLVGAQQLVHGLGTDGCRVLHEPEGNFKIAIHSEWKPQHGELLEPLLASIQEFLDEAKEQFDEQIRSN